jgi:RNA polymerase sigma-70 factor (ECF subfamily)
VTGAIVAAADFEDVFRENLTPVYRFIARRVGRALAEDLAAEVFVTAYHRRAAYQADRGAVRPWLYGIATNVVRRHGREEQHLLELDARVSPDSLGQGSLSFSDAADERVIVECPQPDACVAMGVSDQGSTSTPIYTNHG